MIDTTAIASSLEKTVTYLLKRGGETEGPSSDLDSVAVVSPIRFL
jgi:hypothetical protein